MSFPCRPPLALVAPDPRPVFMVTNLNDAGAGSLRQAIIDASLRTPRPVIVFKPGLTGTIALTTGQMKILAELDIIGPGSSVIAIDGSAASRAFYLLTVPASADVTIAGLTLTNCTAPGPGILADGGALINRSGNLLLDDVIVSSNAATNAGGGLRLDDDTTLRNVEVSGNTAVDGGGGIYVTTAVTLTAEDSTISGNASGASKPGAGIKAYQAALDLSDTTISGNTTSNALGGAIYQAFGSLTMARSTVSGNVNTGGTAGGLVLYQVALDVENCTIADNSAAFGGGIEADSLPSASIRLTTISGNTATTRGGGLRFYNSTVDLENSIVGANTSPSQPDVGGVGPSPTLNANYSLIKDAVDIGTLVIAGANNITGVDPQLGALGNNGGPTETMLPAPTSPAIDAGDPAFAPPPSTDQRGLPRVVAGGLDMGSVEVQ